MTTSTVIAGVVVAALVGAAIYLGWRIILGFMILWSVLHNPWSDEGSDDENHAA